jgi:hypothetical protein
VSRTYRYEPWHITHSIAPACAFLSAVLYGLYILSYAPRTSLTRKLHILCLLLPLWYALRCSDDISSSYMIVDTFSRTCIIWFAHMSYEVCVLEFSPAVVDKSRDIEGGGKMGRWQEMRERVRQGYKVLFDRNHTQILESQGHKPSLPLNGNADPETYAATDKKTDEPLQNGNEAYPAPLPKGKAHGYTRTRFLTYHLILFIVYYSLRYAYEHFEHNWSPLVLYNKHLDEIALGSFFRRLPTSLHWLEIWYRAETAFDWNIVSLWMYESFHSAFALFWVVSNIDAPEEWSMSLFGPLASAVNVRSYWGKHWHNYVYHSFSGHVKILTRNWLGFKRGRLGTRILENTLVFFLSGLMHSLVRWQQSPLGDVWAICLFYVGQMLPIVAESIVSHYWRKGRKSWGIEADAKRVNRLEYAVGYCWVMGWFMWSVPKYLATRMQWTDDKLRKVWGADFWKDRPTADNVTGTEE